MTLGPKCNALGITPITESLNETLRPRRPATFCGLRLHSRNLWPRAYLAKNRSCESVHRVAALQSESGPKQALENVTIVSTYRCIQFAVHELTMNLQKTRFDGSRDTDGSSGAHTWRAGRIRLLVLRAHRFTPGEHWAPAPTELCVPCGPHLLLVPLLQSLCLLAELLFELSAQLRFSIRLFAQEMTSGNATENAIMYVAM